MKRSGFLKENRKPLLYFIVIIIIYTAETAASIVTCILFLYKNKNFTKLLNVFSLEGKFNRSLNSLKNDQLA
jgi:hypothetical protein